MATISIWQILGVLAVMAIFAAFGYHEGGVKLKEEEEEEKRQEHDKDLAK